jgi:hypothetical protein
MLGSAGKVGRRHQHHQQAAEDGTDIGHPGQHGADQAQRQRPGNAEQPESGGQRQGVEDGQVDQALEIGARRAVDFVQQVERALEEGIGHGVAPRKRLKRRPSRRKKKARKGASSSDGVQAMMPAPPVPGDR